MEDENIVQVPIAEYIVRSCIHLVSSALPDFTPLDVGSGVIIAYKKRFFLCTVHHFVGKDGRNVGIVMASEEGKGAELVYYGNFCYVGKVEYEEDYMDMDDLLYCFGEPNSQEPFDIAFREIEPIAVTQENRVYTYPNGEQIEIKGGYKYPIVVEEDYKIDVADICGFYGRVRPDRIKVEGKLYFEELIHWGQTIEIMDRNMIRIDTGAPLTDFTAFRGCSGGPIIGGSGKLLGLVTHGDPDPSSPYVYGFRADTLLTFIELTYFQPLPKS